MTSGGGLRLRHAGHRFGCLPSAARRGGRHHRNCHRWDWHHGPCCGGNRRTGTAGHPRRPPDGVIRRNPRTMGRRDADGPHPAPDPGGHTARRGHARVHRSWTGGHRRGPGTSLIRQRPASTSQPGADRPVKACLSTPSRPGRRGRTRHRHPPTARTSRPFRPGKARSRHGRNPAPHSCPRHRGMRQRPGTRQNRRGTDPSPSSGEPARRRAGRTGRAGMGRRGPARCRHCHDRSRPLCSS